MSNLSTNKQLMIHVASEIIVLSGITFYFNQKNKYLLSHIETLSQRVEEQEDIINKHEDIINKLVEYVKQQQKNNTPVQSPERTPERTPVQSPERTPERTPVQSPERVRVTFKSSDDEDKSYNILDDIGDDDDNIDDDNIDDEIALELEDLEDDSNLKKE